MATSETPEERLRELGLTLPVLAAPVANYIPYVLSGKLLYLAGQISRKPDGTPIIGTVGDTLTTEHGFKAAEAAALYSIALMKTALGDLTKVVQVVRMLGMVNATPDFEAHPKVMNGASDLLVAVFGEQGRHARAAVGVSSLPLGCAVELEITVEVSS
jgi:enamine deaminase RidA (YjgF/YER057c/UK114 family)